MDPADGSPLASNEFSFEKLRVLVGDMSTVISSLDAMRNEHVRLMAVAENSVPVTDGSAPNSPSSPSLSTNHGSVQQEKVNVYGKSLEKILLHLDETRSISVLAARYHELEDKNCKLEAQVERLCDENDWLRTELSVTQQRLNESEARASQLEEEKEQMTFMKATDISDSVEVKSESNEQVSNGLTPWDSPRSTDREEEIIAPGDNETDVGKVPVSLQTSNPGGPSADDIPQRLRTLHALVSQYSKQGRLDVAVPLCKQALEHTERTNGFYNMDVATLLNMLALLYRDQGKLEEACELLHNAVRIKEHCLGPHDLSVASALNNLSVLYGKRRMWAEASPFCKQALAIREAVHGSHHSDVAKLLNNLALICQNIGEFGESEGYYKRAIEVYKQLYGPGHAITTRTMNNLAACYLKQKKHDDAKNLYAEVLLHTQQVETTFSGSAEQVVSPTTPMSAGNWQSMCTAISPTMDGVAAYGIVSGSQSARAGGAGFTSTTSQEDALPKKLQTFDVTNMGSSSPMEDAILFASPYPHSSPPTSTSGQRRGEAESPASATSSTGEPAKRVSSFSRLRGSVGKALGKVMSNDKNGSRQRRSSSLPRQGSDEQDDASRSHSVTEDPTRAVYNASPSPASSAQTPRQQVLLAGGSPVVRSNSAQAESASAPLPRRGPLRAFRQGELRDETV